MEPKKRATWQTILLPFGAILSYFQGRNVGCSFQGGFFGRWHILSQDWRFVFQDSSWNMQHFRDVWVLSFKKVVSHAQEKEQISFHPLAICERHNTSLQFLVIKFITFDYIIFAYSIQSPVMLLIFIILTIFDYPMPSGWTTSCTCTVSYVLHQFFLVQCFNDFIYTKKTRRLTWNIIPWRFGSDHFPFPSGWWICRFQPLIFLGWNTKKINGYMTPESPLKMMSPGTPSTPATFF